MHPSKMTFWQSARAVGLLLRPTNLQSLAAVLPAAMYSSLSFGQGEEVLSLVGESFAAGGAAGMPWRYFLLANGIAGLAIWWAARVVLQFKFDGRLPGAELPDRFEHQLRRSWPRALGILPVLIIALKLWQRASLYRSADEIRGLHQLALLHVLLAVLLFLFFWSRRGVSLAARKLRTRQPGRKVAPLSEAVNCTLHPPDLPPRVASYSELHQASPWTARTHFFLLVLALGVLAAVWIAPLGWTTVLGTGAMFSLAAAAWVTIGTHVLHLRASTGAPVVTLLLGLVLLFSAWNDNHFIRLTKEELRDQKLPSVDQAFSAWRASVPASPGRKRPLFIVAAEGGGIRAAYWTATVLGKLQEESLAATGASETEKPVDFASHLFAVSGVSGGSIGAGVFTALYVDNQKCLLTTAQSILGRDHLAPLMGGLLFPETVQRLSPWVLPGTDRAAIFEHSLEKAYLEMTNSDRFSRPFLRLWEPAPGVPPRHIPHLLFNSTLVETGQRLIFSDLLITEKFLAGGEALAYLHPLRSKSDPLYDVPLSTASHASARFPYTNPPGTLGSGEHFVDGGVFENSGCTAVLEILQMLAATPVEPTKRVDTIVPVVILIRNDPSLVAEEKNIPKGEENAQPIAAQTLKRASESSKANSVAVGLLAPPEALLNSRDSRATMAIKAVKQFQAQHQDAMEPSRFIEFRIKRGAIPLPLGWSLSVSAAAEIRAQIDKNVPAAARNLEAIESVRQWLALPPAPSPR